MKTREEVERLKTNWQADPIWDLETTKGFEEYREELLGYRRWMESVWEKLAKKELKEAAKRFGVRGNLALANTLQTLQGRIERLEQIIIQMRNQE